MEDYSKLRKDQLIAALIERDNELDVLRDTTDKAMRRLTESESTRQHGVKHTAIDAGEAGEFSFRANGITIQGIYYAAEDLKNNTDVAVALYKSGSELIKKTK